MVDAANDFRKRMKRISKKHARLEHGYVAVVSKDGLIITKPKRKGGSFPLRILLTLIVCFVGFKVLLISHLGPEGYAQRVDVLHNGSVLEQGGAWLLQADPVSLVIADGIRKLTL